MDDWLPISPRRRAALATAAVCTAASLGAVVLTLFDQASPPQWLAATPQVQVEVSRCEAWRERQPRQTCLKRVVAERSGDAQAAPVQVARQAPPDASR